MPRPRDLLNLQEAMDWLGVSRATIDRWRKQKQLPYIKIGKEVMVDRHKLEAWVQLYASELGESSVPPKTADPHLVTVGYQSGAALLWSTLVVKQLGLFEAELAAARLGSNVKVRWVNASNGMELVEELIAGNVHIASVGDYPIIAGRSLSRLLPRFNPVLIAFAGKTQGSAGISIVAPPGETHNRPDLWAELKVSTVAHSSASYRLGEWMKVSGLNLDPIQYRRMGDCLSGLMERRVGAAMLWEPYLTWAKLLGAGYPLPVETSGDYLTGLLADCNWAARHEDLISAYLRAHLKAHAFIRKEPERAARHIQEGSGFPLEVVFRVLKDIRWDASFYQRDLMTLAKVGSGQPISPFETAPGTVEIESISRYLQEAAATLKLPPMPDTAQFGEWSDEVYY